MNATHPSDRQPAAAPRGEPLDELGERDPAYRVLEATDWHKEEFLATLAHELRNPLAPIRSAVEIMRMAEGDAAMTAAARSIIERQVNRLVRLIDDLVDVSRLTSSKLELKKERTDLAAIVRMAVEINRPLLERKQQHVSMKLAREPLRLEADTTRLAKVFANLLENGAKYSDAGAVIAVEALRDGPYAVVTVTDQGIGIPADRLGRIFDLFTQDDRSFSLHTGLGVGLTLVKHLVELHGGTVSAYSAGPDMGSSFSVRLALLPSEHCELLPLPSSARPARIAPRARVLIADDNYDAAQSLALMLGMDGHDVRTAGDGLEALRIAEEFRPQFVLLDIGMPKLDGYETARRLRERPWARSTRLYALTGCGQEEDRERARRAGFDRHLVKPADPDTLSQLLSQTLAGAWE
ncbi:MAG: hybrid sensor histidine kinase/response regulator [Steroidobacteraceae bacterium]